MKQVSTEVTHGGAVLRVRLAGGRGNVIDLGMLAELAEVAASLPRQAELKALVLEGEGRDFSFGASVADHAPKHVREMLERLHGLVRALVASSLPMLAVVRGRCLGGGLELAALATFIVASPDAELGQPEVRLGVFAPVASVVLPWRLGARRAEQLLVSGRALKAAEALESGLVDAVAEDPEKVALALIERDLLPHSAVALRFALKAARLPLARALDQDLALLERLYLDELMATADAAEGIAAFLAKRPPAWRNR